MARSGSATDARFADGFLAAIQEADHLNLDVTLQHWRPVADLPLPFGRIIGDLGLLFHSPAHSSKTLLIVEREGSGPGNERNILKWFQAVNAAHPVRLDAHGEQISCEQAAVILLLAFCRPPDWGVSDFDKSFAFCEVLARITNECSVVANTPMTIVVRRYPSEVGDWEHCGRHFADQVLQLL